MATSRTPCGLTVDQTIDIIKNHVIGSGYNGRSEVLKGLMSNGFTYSEAKEVTDYYFKIYRRISDKAKVKKPSLLLTPQQRREKIVNNMVVDFLNGKLGSFPMTTADVQHLEEIYRKAQIAETPSLKEKFNDEAKVFVQKFLPGYTNELFKASVYARPLLSSVFFIKSLTSNLYAQAERAISNIIWDGRKADFTFLWKFEGLANQTFKNVLKGGTPATSLYQSEQSIGATKGRVEEYGIEDTDATSNMAKGAFFKAMKFMTKWSNRFNAAPDTRGIFSNAERHFYQLLKEKYREEGLSDKEATQKAFEDMELDDEATAIQMAEDKFSKLNIPAYAANGRPTTEFKVAVEEYRRLKRDDVLWERAMQLSKNDFWKKNMTVASELGFGDYGIFGLKAQALSAMRDKLEKHSKGKLTSAFNLYAFGFLNGASNFAEDALERIPLYAAVKLGFLQARKGKVTDTMLQNDIARRQKDIIVKNFTTAMFFVAARMLENLICKEKSGRESTGEISSGRVQLGVCGIPAFVPPQMIVAYKAYSLVDKASDNDEDFFNTALNLLPVLTQANQIGLGGAIDKIGQGMTNYSVAAAQGNEIRAREELDKTLKTVIRAGSDVGNSFLPLPSRLLSETGSFYQRIRGVGQPQQDLPFAVDESGNKLGLMQTLSKVSISSLGNVTGISEIMLAAKGSNKHYAMDWQGRTVAKFRGSDIVGSGIQYNAYDDILATAGVKPPYVYRLEKIDKVVGKEIKRGYLPKKINVTKKETRYLTDDEYFTLNAALATFNKNHFDENYQSLVELVKKDKQVAKKQLESVFRATKKKGLEAIAKGRTSQDEIYRYILKNWDTGRDQSMTIKGYKGELTDDEE